MTFEPVLADAAALADETKASLYVYGPVANGPYASARLTLTCCQSACGTRPQPDAAAT
ncbi:MAG TPA: hypothetical protein VGM12_06330 [Trebonia sp.]